MRLLADLRSARSGSRYLPRGRPPGPRCRASPGGRVAGRTRLTMTRADIEAGPLNIWRYAPLLPVPVDIASRITTEPGFTKLVRADRLARELGMRRLWIKDDTGNPTHSFKDRVVAVALAAAQEMGFKVLACPSTGNLANAVAAAPAPARVRSVVLVPAHLEDQKILTTAV